ncbi:hypothetical protein ZHAS_00008166 [Anopheles sinensis]|uniref:Uncharacterized protein n=1 Tax=Anopheles sinensis TaxID=74873 RepID=A0A084VRZ6_ANOSI|nr:hypothetical protein ZHAS_00008166 [Anopheles sinensis]
MAHYGELIAIRNRQIIYLGVTNGTDKAINREGRKYKQWQLCSTYDPLGNVDPRKTRRSTADSSGDHYSQPQHPGKSRPRDTCSAGGSPVLNYRRSEIANRPQNGPVGFDRSDSRPSSDVPASFAATPPAVCAVSNSSCIHPTHDVPRNPAPSVDNGIPRNVLTLTVSSITRFGSGQLLGGRSSTSKPLVAHASSMVSFELQQYTLPLSGAKRWQASIHRFIDGFETLETLIFPNRGWKAGRLGVWYNGNPPRNARIVEV